jgi:DNA-binding MurR/RpiR family transcriptional regulator
MSHSIALFLFRHLRQIRPRVYLISEYEEEWPEYLLRMGRKDVLLVFDYRRYQLSLERLSALAARERGAQIILFTHKWLSPVSKYSAHTLPAAVDVGTPWDTSLPVLLIAEAIINRVSEHDWGTTRKRIELWDDLRVPGDPPSNLKSDPNMKRRQ